MFDHSETLSQSVKMWNLLNFYFLLLAISSFEVDAKANCGIGGGLTGLVVNGTKSTKGQWPWLVALFDIQSNEFFCGGSLINDQMIITVNLTIFIVLQYYN